MLSLNTNISDLILQRTLLDSTYGLNEAINRMTTGFKVNHAKDNAAGYSIIENLNTKISSMLQVQNNTEDGLSLLYTAQDTLDEIVSKYKRLRELSIQAANGTYGGQSLDAIQAEADALQAEIERIKESTTFDGNKIFGQLKTNEAPVARTLSLLNRALNTSNQRNISNVEAENVSLYSQPTRTASTFSLEQPTNNSDSIALMSLDNGVAVASEVIDGGTSGSTTVARGQTVTINIDGTLYEVTNRSATKDFSWSKSGDTITFNGATFTIRGESGKAHDVVLNDMYMYFHGAELADKITLNNSLIRVYSGDGNDIINLRSSFWGHYLFTEDGDDLITGNAMTRSYIYTGAGEDTIDMNGLGQCYVDMGADDDIVDIETNTHKEFYMNAFYGGSGTNTITVRNNTKNAFIYGFGENDTKNTTAIELSTGETKNININGRNYTITNKSTISDKNIFFYSINETTKEVTLYSSQIYTTVNSDENQNIILYSMNSRLTLGAGNDNVCLRGSNSYVYTNDGNDKIINYGADNNILAGNGDDYIEENSAYSKLYGEAGNDTIVLNIARGNNYTGIDGGIDSDTYHINEKMTLVSDSGGDNTYYINADNVNITAGTGNDTFYVSGSNNIINGNAGTNNFIINKGSNNKIDGGTGVGNTIIDKGSNTEFQNITCLNKTIPFDLNIKVDIGGGEGKYISTSLGFNTNTLDLDFTSRDGALNNIAQLDDMIAKLESQLVSIGSTINRLNSVLDEQTIRIENMISSRSTLRDADIAKESSNYIKYQILQQASSTLMASSRNLRYENVLGLLQGIKTF